ncbi:MAG: hypothetical protein HOW73_01880 [Polyangiaceae bacterium]|nr:hypothetical protein [Polyangiaceae bacterium]
MNDLELKKAIGAFRDEFAGSSPDATETLDRVLTSTEVSTRRRARFAKLWIPIAAVLVGSTAWAAANGSLSAMWTAARGEDPSAPPAPSAMEAAATETPAPSLRRAVAPVTAPTEAIATSEPVPTFEKGPTAEPSVSASAHSSSAHVAARDDRSAKAPIARPNGFAEDKADFESAYRIHAAGNANQAAIAAWNDYLAKHPKGRFVPEARYARAVALARAGLRNEAREALKPFADGQPGSYRRDEALELLDNLGESQVAAPPAATSAAPR